MHQHRLISLRRVIIAGCLSFVRNAWLSIAAMAVMLITLTIVLFSLIANVTFNKTIQSIRDRIDISVYLDDSVSETQRNDFISTIKKDPNVRSITYITKEQALASYKKQNQSNIELQLAISQTDNPLPASLQVKLYDPNKIGTLKSLLETPQNKKLQSEDISYSGERKIAVDNITKTTTFVREAGIASVIIFTVTSVLIIFNTIQMTIFNRREELGIMRLLGASKWFIRGPFIVESILYGVISAAISVVLCNIVFVLSSSRLGATSLGIIDINYASQYFKSHLLKIIFLQILLGLFIGVGSSLIATQRYLRIKSVN